MPGDSGELAVNTRVHTYYQYAHTRLRVHWAPGIPHALDCSGRKIHQQLGCNRAARLRSRVQEAVFNPKAVFKTGCAKIESTPIHSSAKRDARKPCGQHRHMVVTGARHHREPAARYSKINLPRPIRADRGCAFETGFGGKSIFHN
jgi:hypothetical protein